MQTREWRFIDKAEWPDGPWKQEPDKVQWQDEATGLPCLIRRGPVIGALCGYVGVPEGHPLHGRDYSDLDDISVHGGLTYAGECEGGELGICHIPDPGEPDNIYWFGFDCGHWRDVTPANPILYQHNAENPKSYSYRDVDYVRAECSRLAHQLQAAAASSLESGALPANASQDRR